VGLCVFDLDHTLVRTPLDLAAMAADMQVLVERERGPLPSRGERWRVGELIDWCRAEAPALEARLWTVALDHERRAMDAAVVEPGAHAAISGARRLGLATAIWTNNARAITLPALARLGLESLLDLIVTRDDMRALKPDPDGWRVIAGHFGGRARHTAIGAHTAVVVGDSWVDGLAAAAAGVPFVAYRADRASLDRWRVTPVAHLDELALLPAWLATRAAKG